MQSVSADHEHEFEAELGLPEPLPAGERLLWQGSPDWWHLAVRAFHVRKLALYFAVIVAVRVALVLSDGGSIGVAALSAVWLTALFSLGLGLLAFMAHLSARTTVYTVTDRRVVMRVGIVLSLTFNLPLKTIETASLRAGSGGVGDIPLKLHGKDRIAFLHLWPHVRPWRVKRPEPMLRCVPQAEAVAALLRAAWLAGTGADIEATQLRPVAQRATSKRGPDSQPAMAAR
jgi:hypothetical protein